MIDWETSLQILQDRHCACNGPSIDIVLIVQSNKIKPERYSVFIYRRIAPGIVYIVL